MIKYEIIDNCLNDSDYDQLVDNIMPCGHTPRTVGIHTTDDVAWDFVNETVTGDELEYLKKATNIKRLEPINDLFLCHMFLQQGFQSQWFRVLAPILNVIRPLALYRIQANLTIQQKEKRRSIFHIDSNEKVKHGTMVTSIFYMNTTNGPTILEDGTEIECRANRLVSYPYDVYHAGILCTDQPYRVVINFNYFK